MLKMHTNTYGGWASPGPARGAYTLPRPLIAAMGTTSEGREREKFIEHKQINDVTIKIINSCGRLPARKFPSSWPPMQIQIILFYM